MRTKNDRNSDKRASIGEFRGFTLVELLVVIAILALLMGILMPVLGRAREAGRSTVCMSNIRGISLAGRIYVDENDGRFPPFRMAAGWSVCSVQGASRTSADHRSAAAGAVVGGCRLALLQVPDGRSRRSW